MSDPSNPRKCERCDGCGKIANTAEGDPWSRWEALPEQHKAAVHMGVVKPRLCPDCNGSGQVYVSLLDQKAVKMPLPNIKHADVTIKVKADEGTSDSLEGVKADLREADANPPIHRKQLMSLLSDQRRHANSLHDKLCSRLVHIERTLTATNRSIFDDYAMAAISGGEARKLAHSRGNEAAHPALEAIVTAAHDIAEAMMAERQRRILAQLRQLAKESDERPGIDRTRPQATDAAGPAGSEHGEPAGAP